MLVINNLQMKKYYRMNVTGNIYNMQEVKRYIFDDEKCSSFLIVNRYTINFIYQGGYFSLMSFLLRFNNKYNININVE